MTPQVSLNCEKLRNAFEGREAIYIEKGVLRVRVVNIRCNVAVRRIDAEVEEILTPGLERSLFHSRQRNDPSPLRWKLGAGYLTSFSEHTWTMGYGGWSIYFAPEVVSGLVIIASNWPTELDAFERYNQAIRFLMDRNAYEQYQRVFPDSIAEPAD
jgi:hypothetical protein